jgi:autotransporter-associated beta strand protein
MKKTQTNILLAAILALGASIPVLHAQTWVTGAGDGNWSDGTKWVGGTAPAINSSGAYTFNGTGTATNDRTGITATSINYDRTTSPGEFTIAGPNAITLGGNIGFSGTAANSNLTINPNLILNGNRTITTNAGTSTNNVTVGGTISSTNSTNTLTKQGQGNLTLSAANSFQGGVILSNGAVTLANAAGLGLGTLNFNSNNSNSAFLATSHSGTVSNNIIQSASTSNGTLVITSNATFDAAPVTFTGTIKNTVGGTTKAFTLNGSNTENNVIGGVIGGDRSNGDGNNSLIKLGTGKWTLTADNTYTGGTTVSAGHLATSGAGTFGDGNITVSNNLTTLTLGNADSIADTATLTFGAGTIINLDFASTATETVGSVVLTGSPSLFLTAGEVYDKDELNALFGGTVFKGTGTLMVASAIPEPSTFAGLAGLAALAFGLGSRRRAKRTAASNR